MLIREPTMVLRDWTSDSRRWAEVPLLPNDIIVATSPKCGTTWTQRIVGMLLRESAEPVAIQQLYPWIDMRSRPIDVMQQALAEQQASTGRRTMKTHSPLDALPLHDDVLYIHVARDARDACMSFHNHVSGYTEMARAMLDHTGVTDETIAAPFPPNLADPQAFFRAFLEQADYAPFTEFTIRTYCALGESYWAERHRPNVLLVHYNDLRADLDGEMRRIAEFCGITVAVDVWSGLVAAADFSAMKRDGAALMPGAEMIWAGGSDRFLNQGTNQRWRSILGDDDLAAYDAAADAGMSPTLRAWSENGRLLAGDPRTSAD
jgi:aryl sulfotransferase